MGPMMATIVFFTGDFVPQGWHACDGALLPVSQNPALYSLIGTTYGGDGNQSFALPAYRAHSPGSWIIAIEGDYPQPPDAAEAAEAE